MDRLLGDGVPLDFPDHAFLNGLAVKTDVEQGGLGMDDGEQRLAVHQKRL